MSPRRQLLKLAAAAGGTVLSAPLFVRHARAAEVPRFGLGVASGQPHAGGMVPWTMLTGADLPARAPVAWEVAEDQAFTKVAARGEEAAVAEDAHSVHAEPVGLPQARVSLARSLNPHLHHAQSDRRGYMHFVLTPGELQADLRVLDDARQPGSPAARQPDSAIGSAGRFVVAAGRPGPQRD